LWTGALEGAQFDEPVNADAVRDALSALDVEVHVGTRLRLGVSLLSAFDPWRLDLTPAGVRRTAGRAINGMVDVLAPDGTPPAGLARRLWPVLTEHPPNPDLVRCLDAALILMADRGLTASTAAARAAASARADPTRSSQPEWHPSKDPCTARAAATPTPHCSP
jgi:citrate synthase